ncbi:transposase [Ectothiorhodospiraceae bacterium 2226]|nr:transposase [Ectothiorhodospiraceae bacterium 2226]
MHRTRLGTRAKGGYSRKVAKREREPWLLAYSRSLSELPAAHIAALYGKRMQIELSFRDLKSHRFGAAFEDTLTRDAPRLEMLLLIHALAILAAWLEGVAVKSTTLGLQASAPCGKQKHSVVWLGWESLRRRHGILSPPAPDAVRRLRNLLVNAA